MSRYTVELINGQTFGPADEAALRTWASEGRIPPIASIRTSDGTTCRAIDCPPIAEIISRLASAPPTAAGAMPQEPDPAVSKLIPYKNLPALIGYYTSIAALIPMVGLAAGPAAIVLGTLGLKKANANPHAHGRVHAWVAIVLGSLAFLLYAGILALVIAVPKH